MAFIPDQAIEQSHTITAAAFRLYSLLCRRRDHKRQVSNLKRRQAERLLFLKRSTIYKAFAELRDARWIVESEPNEFCLLKGDFIPVDKKFLPSLRSKKTDDNSVSADEFSKKPDKKSAETDTALYNNNPASGSRNLNQPTHHNAGGGVRSVSSENFSQNDAPKSRFTIEECLRYVEIRKQQGDEIRNPLGLATTLFRTGEHDSFINAVIRPEEQKKIEIKTYGEPVKFTEDPCSVCYGGKMCDAGDGRYRRCLHCRNEKRVSTGKEPLSS